MVVVAAVGGCDVFVVVDVVEEVNSSQHSFPLAAAAAEVVDGTVAVAEFPVAAAGGVAVDARYGHVGEE